jgi:hypothetical protein
VQDVRCDHVALLVRAVERLRALDPALVPGAIDSFPAEGTREVYLDRGDLGAPPGSARLLLLEATGPGPYARALSRRGPGLHHVGVTVPDARAYALECEGWLLHPRSLDTWPGSKTLWLARPGVGALIEVHEVGAARDVAGAPVVAAVDVPGDARLLAALRCPGVGASDDECAWLTLGRTRVRAGDVGAR